MQTKGADAPLRELRTLSQPWAAAAPSTVSDATNLEFGHFSAVCWFFGKQVYTSLGDEVPLGLVSSTWRGTMLEQWGAPTVTASHPGPG